MADAPRPVATLTSLFQIEALSNPLRFRILRYADEPITVAELADRLGMPKTRLYYHVNLLVEAELLAQVDERRSGARIEKIYRRIAADFELGSGLVEALGDRRRAADAAVTVIFDPARAEATDYLECVLGGGEVPAHLGRTLVRLGRESAERYARRVKELVNEVRELDVKDGGEIRTYSLTAAFVPIDTLEKMP